MADLSTYIYKTICTNLNVENNDFKHVFIQKLLESIDSSA